MSNKFLALTHAERIADNRPTRGVSLSGLRRDCTCCWALRELVLPGDQTACSCLGTWSQLGKLSNLHLQGYIILYTTSFCPRLRSRKFPGTDIFPGWKLPYVLLHFSKYMSHLQYSLGWRLYASFDVNFKTFKSNRSHVQLILFAHYFVAILTALFIGK